MIIENLLKDIGILAVTLAVGVGIGAVRGYKSGVAHDAGLVAAANASTLAANERTQATNATLATIQQKLAAQQQAMQAAAAAAKAALAARAMAQAALAKAESQREQTDRKIANETPNGAELARMPIYPALARRLFGSGETDASASTGGH